MCTWCPALPGSPPPARCSPPPSYPACWATPPAESATLSTRYPPTAPGNGIIEQEWFFLSVVRFRYTWRRICSASSAMAPWSEGGGMLVNCWLGWLNSSSRSTGRDLVLLSFLGIRLMLTSWLKLTWRLSEALDCSDRSDGVRRTCRTASHVMLHWSEDKAWLSGLVWPKPGKIIIGSAK